MIPAYNEEKTIGTVIKNIPRNFVKDLKIVVIDDGSTDNTVKVAKESGADKIVSHNINKGLGVAFQTGLETALKTNADIIVNIDADGQFDPNDIPKLVRPITEGKADMVTCSRFLDKNLEPDMPWIKKFGNAIFTKLVSGLTKQKFTDTQCGFRAYSKAAALKMTLFGVHTYTQEVFLDLATKGMRLLEIPCKVKGERDGKSRVVNTVFSYGLKVLLIIIRSFRDYQPLKFFGTIGFGVFFIGFVIGMTMIARYIFTGMVSPYRSLVNLSMLFLIMGFLLLILALIADMFDRQRKMLEEILYSLRREK